MSEYHTICFFIILFCLGIVLIIIGALDISNLQNCPEYFIICFTSSAIVSTSPAICIKDFISLPSILSISSGSGYGCNVYNYQLCNNFCYTNATFANPIPNTNIIQKGWNELISGIFFMSSCLLICMCSCMCLCLSDYRKKKLKEKQQEQIRSEQTNMDKI